MQWRLRTQGWTLPESERVEIDDEWFRMHNDGERKVQDVLAKIPKEYVRKMCEDVMIYCYFKGDKLSMHLKIRVTKT